MAPLSFAQLFGASLLWRAAAWDQPGHKSIAILAESLLEPDIRAALQEALDGTSLAEAAVWCDEYDHTPEGEWSTPLHYINYPGRACAFDWLRDCVDDRCNPGAILNYTSQLMDRGLSKEQRLFALRFVVHMVGDLHQPLHAGSADDRGGNDILLKGCDIGHGMQECSELHLVWDTSIVQGIMDEISAGSTEEQWHALVRDLQARLAGEWAVAREDWRSGVAADGDMLRLRLGLTGVAEESAALSCGYAYADVDGSPVVSGASLDLGYYERARPVVREQLAKGGVRLAQVLTEAFQARTTPTQLMI